MTDQRARLEMARDYRSLPTVEWADPDENDGEWPPPPSYERREITGPLADAVRRRLGASSDVPVVVTEVTTVGGYSEYTEETDYDMTIVCGDVTKEFRDWDNLDAMLRWLDEPREVGRG